MNKVYLVIYDWSYDFESNNSVVVFSTKDKALKYMNGIIEDIKRDNDYDTFEEDKDNFSGYNEGFYAEKHDTIRIEETIIDKWERR